MKKRIFLLLIILISIVSISFSQSSSVMPTDGNYSNWKWEDQSTANWKRQKNGVWISITPPFKSTSDRMKLLYDISINNDYTYTKGWRLVHANFNNTFPYFILYNINNSLLRGFIYLDGDAGVIHGSVVGMSLTPNYETKKTKLLHFAEDKLVAVNDNSASSVFSKNNLTSFTECGLNSWAAFEIPMLYDNKIASITNATWDIQFLCGTNSTISLNIQGTSVPMDSKGNNLFAHPAVPSGSNLQGDYAKIHTNIKNFGDWAEKIEKTAGSISIKDDSPGYLKTYKNVLDKLKTPSQIASSLSLFSQGINSALGLFDFFFGSSSSALPTGYSHNFTGTGSISTIKIIRGNTMSVPGSSSTFEPWAYNCQMGVLNLNMTPKIKKTTPYLDFTSATLYVADRKPTIPWQSCIKGKDGYIRNSSSIFQYLQRQSWGCGDISKSYSFRLTYGKEYYPTRRYRFDDNIGININDRITVTDAKFAIIFKTSEENYITKKSFVYTLQGRNDKWGSGYIPMDEMYKYEHFSVSNPIYQRLNSGQYELYEYNVPEKTFVFGTKYVNLADLNKINIEVLSDLDVSLGVIIKYQIPGSNETFYFKGTYKLDEIEDPAHKGFLLKGETQSNFPDSDYTNRTRTLYYNRVSYPCENTGSGGSTKSAQATNNLTENVIDRPWYEDNIFLSPNPSDGNLTFKCLDYSDPCMVEIFSLTGSKVFENKKIINGENINISNLTKGVYIAKITIGGFSKTEKIILR